VTIQVKIFFLFLFESTDHGHHNSGREAGDLVRVGLLIDQHLQPLPLAQQPIQLAVACRVNQQGITLPVPIGVCNHSDLVFLSVPCRERTSSDINRTTSHRQTKNL